MPPFFIRLVRNNAMEVPGYAVFRLLPRQKISQTFDCYDEALFFLNRLQAGREFFDSLLRGNHRQHAAR